MQYPGDRPQFGFYAVNRRPNSFGIGHINRKVAATMTLALPKEGLRAPGVEAHMGELYLADISVPPGLYAGPGLGIEVGNLFAENDIIRLR
jgi:hypothetical protein